jgi:spore coat protein U-like protein
MKQTLRLLAAALLLLAASAAQALCIGSCSCTASATNLSFGSVNPLLPAATQTSGTLTVGCTGTAGIAIPFTVALSAGSSGSFTTRRMTSGANTMNYNLYQDAGLTTIWGDGTGGSQTQGGTIILTALILSMSQTFNLYGNIPGSQTTTAPGNYGDTISITLTYY